MIDADGERLTPLDETDQAFASFEAGSQGLGNALSATQLKVLWRLHIFSADRACEEAAFFSDQL